MIFCARHVAQYPTKIVGKPLPGPIALEVNYD